MNESTGVRDVIIMERLLESIWAIVLALKWLKNTVIETRSYA